MKVLVNTPAHFISCGGDIFSHNLTYESFWNRYLAVFDSVMVVGRVKPVKEVPGNWDKSTGPGVELCAIPDYYGPWQYLRVRSEVKSIIEDSIKRADAYILRVPCTLGTLVWRHLMKDKVPYAVEVVANPWDALSPGSVKSLIRPMLRWKMTRDLVHICRNAGAACYVTEYNLQKLYPPGGWSTHCSDVELTNDVIADESVLDSRFKRIKAKLKSGQPWRLCYVGTLGQLYKAPDVLLCAVARCIKKAIDLELTMVGGGQLRPQLEEQAYRLGIADRVQFLGLLPAGKDVFDQFDKADLFVLPSRQEGLPRTMVEAMARGIPSIGSTVGGFPELLEAEDLVPPGDVHALVAKIIDVLSSTERLEKMSRRNLETVKKKFRPQELSRRRVEYYKKVAEITNRAYSGNCC